MSHIVEARTKIRHPDPTLLGQAVELVAQHNEGHLADHYLDWYWNKQPTALALFVPSHGVVRGIAIEVDAASGELKFVGDFWGVRQQVEQLQAQIVQTFVSLATMQALTRLGYTPQVTADENNIETPNGQLASIVVQGVRYA